MFSSYVFVSLSTLPEAARLLLVPTAMMSAALTEAPPGPRLHDSCIMRLGGNSGSI